MVDNECRVSQGGDEEHDNSTILRVYNRLHVQSTHSLSVSDK